MGKKSNAAKKKKMPPPVPCESPFGNPLFDWVPHRRVSDPTTVSTTSAEDGLASADDIKIKAPKAGSVGSPKSYDPSRTPQRQMHRTSAACPLERAQFDENKRPEKTR